MPRPQAYDPSFSYDLGDGYLMNPRSGEIFDSNSNTAYSSADELGASLQEQSQGGQQAQKPSSGNSTAIIPSDPNTISNAYNWASGGGTAATAGSGGAYSLGSSLGSSAFGAGAGGVGATTAGTGAGVGSASLGSSLGGSAFGASAGGVGATAGTAGAIGTGSASLSGALGSSAFGAEAGGVGSTYAAGTGTGTAAGGTTAFGVAWPIAIALSMYKAGANYEDARKASGGTLSKEDWNQVTHMWGIPKPLRGLQDTLNKIPGSPTWIMDTLFGAGKNAQERGARKVSRRPLQELGLMSPDSRSTYTLADGSGFNIADYKAQTGQDAYNIDFNDPNVDNDRVSFLNAITSGVLGDRTRKGSAVNWGKTSSDLTGELYNAAKSDGNFDQNVRSMGDRLGGRNAIYEAVAQRWRNNDIDADKRDALFAAIDKEYGVVNTTGGKWEDTAGLSAKDKGRNDRQLMGKDLNDRSKKPNEGNKIPKAPMANPSSVDPGYTTKPLPLDTRNGGRPATPTIVNSTPYRPGAAQNPWVKNQPYKIPKKK